MPISLGTDLMGLRLSQIWMREVRWKMGAGMCVMMLLLKRRVEREERLVVEGGRSKRAFWVRLSFWRWDRPPIELGRSRRPVSDKKLWMVGREEGGGGVSGERPVWRKNPNPERFNKPRTDQRCVLHRRP